MEHLKSQLQAQLNESVGPGPSDYKDLINAAAKQAIASTHSFPATLGTLYGPTRPGSVVPGSPGLVTLPHPAATYPVAAEQLKVIDPNTAVRKATIISLAMVLINDILKDHPELVEEYPEQFTQLMEYI